MNWKLGLSRLSWRTPASALVLLFIIGFISCQASAASPYTSLDVGGRVLRGQTATLRFSVTVPSGIPGGSVVAGVGLLGTAESRDWGYTPSIGFGYAQYQATRGRWTAGLGAAYLLAPTVYSGSQAQFALSISGRVTDRCSLSLLHLSNAGSAKPNPGMDMITVGCRLQGAGR